MTIKMLCVIIALVACNKGNDPITPVTDPPPSFFEKVWSTRIYEAPLENVGSDNAYLYKDWYIVTGSSGSHLDPSIYAFDTKTGILAWHWQQTGRLQDPAYYLLGFENLLVLSNRTGFIVFDIEQRAMLWEVIWADENRTEGRVKAIKDGYLYAKSSFQVIEGPETYYRYELITGQREILFSVSIEDGWSPTLSPPAFWRDTASGDTIMLFINGKSKISYGPQESPTDLYAVNLRTKQLVWRRDSIMEVPTNLRMPPVVFENSLLFGGDWSIYSVDIPTGQVNWRTQFDNLLRVGNFNSTGLLLVGDRVYGNPGAFDVMCLDAGTGAVLWHNKNAAPTCSPNMLYNDGMLIIGSFGLGSVVIMDGLTGAVLHKERGERSYYTDVLYDPATEMYFVQDFAQAVGFKINRSR